MNAPPTPRRRAHEDRRGFLLSRARILAAVRAWFAARDFIETDVSALVASPGGEAHLHAFETTLVRPGGARERRWLHTSPELAMKKLVAAGERRIYDLARVFRNAEATPLHAPAFTMLEWYRAEELYGVVMEDAVALLGVAAVAAGTDALRWRDQACDPFAAPERLTVADAFARHAGIDLAATLGDAPAGEIGAPPPLEGEGARGRGGGEDAGDLSLEAGRPPRMVTCDGQREHPAPYPPPPRGEGGRRSPAPAAEPDRDALAAQCRAAGIGFAEDETWSDLFSRALVERVEPHLGLGRPTLLVEYPRPEAALARACPHDPRFAERFELYVCGVELANGFGELTDPAEQRRRLEANMDLKEARYGERWPLDEDFLAAVGEMPACSGVALGLDRLVMLATGARRIGDVLWSAPGDG